MTISWSGFTTFVQNGIAAVQAAATSIIDAGVGSVTLAWQQASAGTALWLQAQAIGAMLLTRFATSYGSDADSFGAQFDFSRLPGIAATGNATFARFTPTNQAIIAVGQLIQTGPGGVQFQVIADTTNPLYSPTASGGNPGYIVPANTASATIAIQCTQVGTVGNVLANTIISFVTPIPYVDTVTNTSEITNGFNVETDVSYKSRFPGFIASWREATVAAIQSAVTSLQQGLTANVVEGQTFSGSSDPGFFYVLVDNGTGNPGSTILNAAANAVDNARAAGVQFSVFAPNVITANVVMTVVSSNPALHFMDVAAVQAAIENFISTLPDGVGLPYSQLPGVAYAASPNVPGAATYVTDVPLADYTLNGANLDIAAVVNQVVKPGVITVN